MGRRQTPTSIRKDPRAAGKRAGVLVIDDDVALRRDICEALESEGFPVVAASSGSDAVRWLRASPTKPALIVVDLLMTDLDGAGFIEWLRDSGGALAEIPVAIMSGIVEDLEPIRRRLGAVAALAKPISRDALVRLVKRHCA